jgi:hypothetical protein
MLKKYTRMDTMPQRIKRGKWKVEIKQMKK